MHLERAIVGFSILIVVFAIGYAGTAALGTTRGQPPVPAVHSPDARTLASKLEKLDARLRTAQAGIDEVLLQLADANEPALREATRVRLDVLHRLERGLLADIARTRDALASVGSP